MKRENMIEKLNRADLQGVGVVVTHADGTKLYYFYEDMTDSKGIDRASHHAQYFIDLGKWKKAEYIYKSDNNIYFVDWNAERDNFCMNDFYVRYCKNFNYKFYYYLDSFRAEIHGKTFKFDYLGAIDGISEVVKIPV